jgi:hypothetical protein
VSAHSSELVACKNCSNCSEVKIEDEACGCLKCAMFSTHHKLNKYTIRRYGSRSAYELCNASSNLDSINRRLQASSQPIASSMLEVRSLPSASSTLKSLDALLKPVLFSSRLLMITPTKEDEDINLCFVHVNIFVI